MPTSRTSRLDTHQVSHAKRNRRRSPSIGTRPLAAVQIDWTACDTEVIHPTTGIPLGRPWMTVAIDTNSRMVMGVHLSLAPPSAASIDRCIRHSLSRKTAYLARLDINGTWPAQGPIATIAIDAVPPPRNAALTATLTKHHIRLMRRRAGATARGNLIETVWRQLRPVPHPCPGATRSDPAAASTAALTLRDLERLIVDVIVNVYHLRVSHLATSPMCAWMAAHGDPSSPPMPSRPHGSHCGASSP